MRPRRGRSPSPSGTKPPGCHRHCHRGKRRVIGCKKKQCSDCQDCLQQTPSRMNRPTSSTRVARTSPSRLASGFLPGGSSKSPHHSTFNQQMTGTTTKPKGSGEKPSQHTDYPETTRRATSHNASTGKDCQGCSQQTPSYTSHPTSSTKVARISPSWNASEFSSGGSSRSPHYSTFNRQITASRPTVNARELHDESAVAVGIGVSSGFAAFFLLLILLLLIWLYRRSKRRRDPNGVRHDPEGADQKNEVPQPDTCYLNPSYGQLPDCHTNSPIVPLSHMTSTNTPVEYAVVCDCEHKNRAKTHNEFSPAEVPVPLRNTTFANENMPCVDNAEEESSKYWQPADTLEKLYAQFESKRFRNLQPSQIETDERDVIGSGEFGAVQRGLKKISQGSETYLPIAVKVLKSNCSSEDRIRFLREAAIMGQFKHDNIVYLYGAVLQEDPLMLVMELMTNGDLKHHLLSLRENIGEDIEADLLKMCRDIANGMEYLARMSFIHRDLAARNVLLNGVNTCKIGDFGLARDLIDSDYYFSRGGRLPIRWTAPEAVSRGKYSPASDVWSYGIVLYEIWTVGARPYGTEWTNDYVIQRVESGYRLSPPPGCSRVLYKLMIDCWNPDHHRRPTFEVILDLLDSVRVEEIGCGNSYDPSEEHLGGPLDSAQDKYVDLQICYQTDKS